MSKARGLLLCGAGRVVEKYYAPALRASSDFRVQSVVDPSPARRRWARRKFGVTAYSGLSEALAAERFDAALIATPPGTQAECARILLAHGVPVLIEKPGVATSEQASELLSAANALPLRLALSRRYWPSYRRLRQDLAEEPLESWTVEICTDPLAWAPVVPEQPDLPNALIDDLLPHAWDIATHVLGTSLEEITDVSWDGSRLVVITGRSWNGTIEVRYGGAWAESVRCAVLGRELRTAPGKHSLKSIVPRLYARLRGMPAEPVRAVADLLASFAEDLEVQRTNDDLLECARFLEAVRRSARHGAQPF